MEMALGGDVREQVGHIGESRRLGADGAEQRNLLATGTRRGARVHHRRHVLLLK